MWYIEDGEASRSRFKKINKNHHEEYLDCFVNLDKILALLEIGHKIGGFKVGFFRSEGDGLYRIGQTGVKNSKEVRLYVYPDSDSEIMHILGIGTKETQRSDINEVKKKLKRIKRTKKENA